MLLCGSVRSFGRTSEVIAFYWDAANQRFSSACDADGVRLFSDGAPDKWLYEHDAAINALRRGEDVSQPGRLLIPIFGSGRLEGVLSIGAIRQFDSSVRDAIRMICDLGALALAGLRERDEALTTIATTVSELRQPLIAARGFTRMALDDVRSSSVTSSEYLSAALRNINRLGEVTVGLCHAGTDA